jgi:dihydrofolate synthase/folylpolyglutamate synthase
MNVSEYLLNIPMWTKKKNTIADIRVFLKELGDPEKKLRIIHVAGTNGKGSVCADLTAILREAGYHTGTFISPHLVDIRERFLLDGEMVSEAELQTVFEEVLPVVERLVAEGYCHPSYFEFCFLLTMVLFAKNQTDYCVLETGLGGRLDATNAVAKPLACVITSISLDHTQYLGTTIAAIAGEKAGIIKNGVPVIYDDNRAEASAVIAAKAAAAGAASYPVSEGQWPENLNVVEFGAPYQRMNAALAMKTLEVLHLPGITEDICICGLKKVRWQGRMERVSEHIWLDGAHNPGGMEAFIRAVKTAGAAGNIHLLFAAVSDKDYTQMIRALCEQLQPVRVTVAHLDSARASDQNQLAALFGRYGCREVEQYPDVESALRAALAHRKGDDRLYMVGSLYLIGEIKKLLKHMDLQEVPKE